jgi:hypothetical protein
MRQAKSIRRSILCGLLALAVFGIDAAGVSAQDGVFIDPDRPAGTEYAIPLDLARRGAAPDSPGGAASGGSADASAPRFGFGVAGTSATASVGSNGGSAADGGGAQDRGSGTTRRGEDGDRAGADRREALSGTVAALSDPADGPMPVGLITGGIALGVLILGGGVGLTVRRLRG